MALLVLRSVGVVCRAKPNVPLVRWQKNKKMCVGQKLNLCLVSLSARFFCPFGLGSVVRYHCCQRAGIADGGEFYIRPPGTAAWIFDKVKY